MVGTGVFWGGGNVAEEAGTARGACLRAGAPPATGGRGDPSPPGERLGGPGGPREHPAGAAHPPLHCPRGFLSARGSRPRPRWTRRHLCAGQRRPRTHGGGGQGAAGAARPGRRRRAGALRVRVTEEHHGVVHPGGGWRLRPARGDAPGAGWWRKCRRAPCRGGARCRPRHGGVPVRAGHAGAVPRQHAEPRVPRARRQGAFGGLELLRPPPRLRLLRQDRQRLPAREGPAASGDKTIRIWDVRTTKCIATVNTKGENINICWSPDGQTIAVGNKDDVVTFIDAKTHRSKAEEQFKFEVNEISWNNDNNMFFLTNGNGCINILSYPELKPIQSINAHPSNCICIKFDPMGKYFATGSADALVSLWDVDELVCVRCFSRLDWPVRTLSFSHDGKMLASASEDHFIDIAEVETGEKLWEVQCESPTFTVAWHPKRPLLAFACDDKDGKYDSSREAGTVKLFGLPNDS
ncbi:THO complex subunit 3 isoform X1 [Chiroxiphia lanceolata]|uniref:THO complex subunit 3 isoform X1 n=1 Tax=Chiroxiphia lanceolata TaxID=296741 RepID=UPI0013CF20CE|nr:THO complex subunit 3 isoform X1 [Chiroxiphia lanceolata]